MPLVLESTRRYSTMRGRAPKSRDAKPKRRRLIRALTPAMRLQIDALTPLGFSHRYIASWIYMTTFDRVTDTQAASVTAYITRQQISVLSWRNGVNSVAHSFANKALTGVNVNGNGHANGRSNGKSAQAK